MRSLNSILITGGAGYVGSVLVRKLVSLGYDVKVIDSLVFGNDGISSLINEKKIEFFNLDIRETEKISIFFHLLKMIFHHFQKLANQ
jgi:UDP-glucose 4-epimerase